MALVYADITDSDYGPVGRFGYKCIRGGEKFYLNLLAEAESQKDNWPPIKAGLFRNSYERFEKVASIILALINQMHYF